MGNVWIKKTHVCTLSFISPQVIGRVLINFEIILDTYQQIKGEAAPIAHMEAPLAELYSLMRPIADLIRDCQGSSQPTGVLGHVQLLYLRRTTLDVNKSLRIIDPRTKAVAKKRTFR